MAQKKKGASKAALKAIATMRREHGNGYFRQLGLKAAKTRKQNG
jgi:hypothetical protein